MQTCYRHPDRETGVSCSNCGKPICPDCMTPTTVGMRCPECAGERTKVRTVRTLTDEPRVTYALIAINVVVFLAELASGAGAVSGALGGDVVRRGALFGPKVADGEYWRILTGGFLHATFFHLLFNMYALYVLGSLLEPAIGKLRFAIVYMASLFAGSFGVLLVSPDAVTVGASGAVFGLMGASLVIMRSRGIGVLESGIGIWLLLNLALTFTVSGISIGGHVGGLVGGALAGLALLEAPRLRIQAPLATLLAALVGVVSIAGAIAVA
ncbi:MAG: rhomboid family intramembrane serine protease [Thermoleophilaceae bacterium]|nr:rhomboid family intramembrane serine protease [Thermoleophilaceae bacterium]